MKNKEQVQLNRVHHGSVVLEEYRSVLESVVSELISCVIEVMVLNLLVMVIIVTVSISSALLRQPIFCS